MGALNNELYQLSVNKTMGCQCSHAIKSLSFQNFKPKAETSHS